MFGAAYHDLMFMGGLGAIMPPPERELGVITAIGTLRIGKYTLLNRISGKEVFKANDDERSVTTGFDRSHIVEHDTPFQLIDTMGLNDHSLPLSKWVELFKKSMLNVEVNLVIFVM